MTTRHLEKLPWLKSIIPSWFTKEESHESITSQYVSNGTTGESGTNGLSGIPHPPYRPYDSGDPTMENINRNGRQYHPGLFVQDYGFGSPYGASDHYHISQPTLPDFSISSDNGCVVKFMANGNIEIGDGYTPTEAGDEFLLRLLEMYPWLFERTI